MALVKKLQVVDEKANAAAEKAPAGAPRQAGTAAGAPRNNAREADQQKKRARTLAKQQQAAERIASATTQLSSGITESASAAEELQKAMEQIANGAEEASGAAQESVKGVTQAAAALLKAKDNAETSRTKSENLQTLVANVSGDIAKTIVNIDVAAERQAGSVKMVAELEQQAANIGDIVKAVARIADQTNLLATPGGPPALPGRQ